MSEYPNNETIKNVTEAVADSTIKSGNKLVKVGIIGGATTLVVGAACGAFYLFKKVVGKIKSKKANADGALPEGAVIEGIDPAEVETIKD